MNESEQPGSAVDCQTRRGWQRTGSGCRRALASGARDALAERGRCRANPQAGPASGRSAGKRRLARLARPDLRSRFRAQLCPHAADRPGTADGTARCPARQAGGQPERLGNAQDGDAERPAAPRPDGGFRRPRSSGAGRRGLCSAAQRSFGAARKRAETDRFAYRARRRRPRQRPAPRRRHPSPPANRCFRPVRRSSRS